MTAPSNEFITLTCSLPDCGKEFERKRSPDLGKRSYCSRKHRLAALRDFNRIAPVKPRTADPPGLRITPKNDPRRTANLQRARAEAARNMPRDYTPDVSAKVASRHGDAIKALPVGERVAKW